MAHDYTKEIKKAAAYCALRRIQKRLCETCRYGRRQELVAKAGRKFKSTTNSAHKLPVSPNLLNQDFSCEKINKKWAGDITYLWTDEGWLYLAVVLDLYSRRVIGWSMSDRMNKELACDADGNQLTY